MISNVMRTHYCGEINESHIGQTVVINGWVHNQRNFGGLIFIKIRDCSGFIQVIIDPSCSDAFANAANIRPEYVVSITGVVRQRPKEAVKTDSRTGLYEIVANNLNIINPTEPLPFLPDDHQNVSEEIRLKYRYIDLRRTTMLKNLQLRAQVTRVLRNFLDNRNFLDIETPFLTKATPEGARDYVVPSRTNPGCFYALPQSPQLFKQLLMVAGVDRYYQIVRCFRDEDLRADRQPEFTQLDIEMSFMNENDIMQLMENMIIKLFKEVLNINLPSSFVKLPYAEAIRRFGTDRPDLRNPLEFVDLADLMIDIDLQAFKNIANNKNGRIIALKIPQANKKLSRKAIDDYAAFITTYYGAQGLTYIKVNDDNNLQSPILKFLSETILKQILTRTQAVAGDILLICADRVKIVNEAMAALRNKIGVDLKLLINDWKLLWVVDFPMFELDAKQQKYVAVHHPFTAPKVTSITELKQDPANCLAKAYDLVLNGIEIGGGSLRIHTVQIQQAVFDILGITSEQAIDKFGFLLDALKFGCPIHGGIAFGLDRLVMLMCGANSIRDVIAFPKTLTASCPLTSAPTKLAKEQLDELGININLKQDNL